MQKTLWLSKASIRAGDETIPHFFLFPYLPIEAGQDPVSHSLVRFKQRLRPDLDDWIAAAVTALKALRFPSGTVILRPLHHDETTARPGFPGGLDLLGAALAAEFGYRYLPGILSKAHPTLPNKHLPRSRRRTELLDVYRLETLFPSTTFFLLIDDILTTGATIRAVVAAIRRMHPANPVTAFTLTRAANTV
ncbi:MAG TPA: hypothetical protein VN616_07190 [Puia sp.]|nr:hypothetical protein [Puia sp.]